MKRFINKWTILVIAGVLVIWWAITVKDWHQLWVILSAPDNVPIGVSPSRYSFPAPQTRPYMRFETMFV